MGYEAKVICDSMAPNGRRLTTVVATFPRIILAEVNTHTIIAKNSASSRAIPVRKMIQRVMDDPFIPNRFPVDRPGMQAQEYYTPDMDEYVTAKRVWLGARDSCVAAVEHLIGNERTYYSTAHNYVDLKVHKQIANRLLEPWLWHTAILTATEWANFFFLRCHRDAQPEFRIIARMIYKAMEGSRPQHHFEDGVHLPFIDKEDIKALDLDLGKLVQVSTARCARVSVLNHEGKKSYEDDFKMFNERLHLGKDFDANQPRHMSPTQHIGMARGAADGYIFSGQFRGWVQYRKTLKQEAVWEMDQLPEPLWEED